MAPDEADIRQAKVIGEKGFLSAALNSLFSAACAANQTIC
jgi:hypothetical protein